MIKVKCPKCKRDVYIHRNPIRKCWEGYYDEDIQTVEDILLSDEDCQWYTPKIHECFKLHRVKPPDTINQEQGFNMIDNAYSGGMKPVKCPKCRQIVYITRYGEPAGDYFGYYDEAKQTTLDKLLTQRIGVSCSSREVHKCFRLHKIEVQED